MSKYILPRIMLMYKSNLKTPLYSYSKPSYHYVFLRELLLFDFFLLVILKVNFNKLILSLYAFLPGKLLVLMSGNIK